MIIGFFMIGVISKKIFNMNALLVGAFCVSTYIILSFLWNLYGYQNFSSIFAKAKEFGIINELVGVFFGVGVIFFPATFVVVFYPFYAFQKIVYLKTNRTLEGIFLGFSLISLLTYMAIKIGEL